MVDNLSVLLFFYVSIIIFSAVYALISKIAVRCIDFFGKKELQQHKIFVQPTHVITLIHGTWARDADWTQPDSKLCSALRDKDGWKINFRGWSWNGGNSFKDRDKASASIREQIASSLRDFPSAKHFVIAHSHGGSVAIDALDEAASKSLSGVICLSTPVLVTHPRAVKFSDLYERWIIPLSFAALGAMLAVFFCRLTSIVMEVLGLLLLELGLAAAVISFQVARREIRLDRGKCLISKHKIVFLRVFGDEAASLIAASHLIGFAASAVYSFIETLSEDMQQNIRRLKPILNENPVKTGFSIIAFVFLATILLLVFTIKKDVTKTDWSDFVMMMSLIAAFFLFQTASFGAFFISPILQSAINSLRLPVHFALSGLGLVAGPEMLALASKMEISAEPTPIGEWDLVIFQPDMLEAADKELILRHSMVYNNDTCIDYLVKWISDRTD